MMPLVSKAHVDRSDPWTADVETVWMTVFMESRNTVCWRLFVETFGKSWSKSDLLFSGHFKSLLQNISWWIFNDLPMIFWGWFPSFEIPGCCFLWCWNLEHPIQAAEIQHVDSRCANFKIKSPYIFWGGSLSLSLRRWVNNNNCSQTSSMMFANLVALKQKKQNSKACSYWNKNNCRTTFCRNCWKVVSLKIYVRLPNYPPKAIAAMYGAKVPPVDLVKIFEV